jgi:preprotein translocase subunit SecE
MATITEYLKEVKAEMAHVTWPTKRDTVLFTIGVLVISIVVAYYLGLLDYLFTRALDALLNR